MVLLSLRHGRIVDQELFDQESMVLLSLCHGRIVDQELFEVGFSKSQCVVLRDLSCGYHGFWIPRGGFSTSGRLSVVNAGFERFSVGFREHLIDSDRVQGEVGRAPKVTSPSKSAQRAEKRRGSQGGADRRTHGDCGNCSPRGGRSA